MEKDTNKPPIEIRVNESLYVRMNNYQELSLHQMYGDWIVEISQGLSLESLPKLLTKILPKAIERCSPKY
jgi:hypothetical protein